MGKVNEASLDTLENGPLSPIYRTEDIEESLGIMW